MPALRILHVAPYFEDAWAYGGIPRVVSALTHALARNGHKVTVATTDVRDATSRLKAVAGSARHLLAARGERTTDGIDLRIFPNLSNTFAYRYQLYLPVGFASFLRSDARAFDVAHLHACHNLLTSTAARHLWRAGVPYVVQPNGTAMKIERRRAAKAAFDLLLARRDLPGAAAVIAVTEAERPQLQNAGVPTATIRVLPNPVAAAPFDALPARGVFRRRHGLTDGPLVAFLGMLSPRKQPEVLARAVARTGRADVQLVFAGNDMGSLRRTEDVVRKLGLEPRTRFTGLLEGVDRFVALADADIIAYPSRDEVFGLVPLEALQVGTPVIVCNDSGCGEIVGDIGGGTLVPPGDSDALATALAGMLADLPRWRQAAGKAAAVVAARFHPEVVCRQLERVYKDVTGGD